MRCSAARPHDCTTGLGLRQELQRADLVAVGVAQVDQVELAARAFGHPQLRDFA